LPHPVCHGYRANVITGERKPGMTMGPEPPPWKW